MKKKKLHQKKSPAEEAKKPEVTKAACDNNDSGHGDSETASTIAPPASPVEVMTSHEFQMDTRAHVDVIHEALKDTIRVQNFKAAILHNKHLFKDKCVLDIGCGVGILSLFAAKAGAAKVYAVDSSNVVYYTRKIVEANGYEGVIEVLKGDIEEVQLPVKEVDIIVSDWMGYALLFQSKCKSVIYARDKWLKKPDGIIFPDQAKLFMVALEDGKHKNENIDWWTSVYGFNMNCLREVALKEPRFQLVKPQQVLSTQFPIFAIDLNTATRKDLGFRSKYMLPIQRSGCLDGFILYFHTYFTKTHTPLGFSTDPWSAGTNWMQTIFFFDQSHTVKEGDLYYGGIEFCPEQKSSELNDIIVNLELLKGDPAQADVDLEMSWRMKPITLLMAPTDLDDDTKTVGLQRDIKEDVIIQSHANFHSVNQKNVKNLSTTTTGLNKTTTKVLNETTIISNNIAAASKPPMVKTNTKMLNETTTISKNIAVVSAPPMAKTANNFCSKIIGDSFSVTIGKHNYPCRKERRRKNKPNKKG